ncbi:ARID DNA-binding domain-containing protein [Tanacetum coccineum]
MHENTHSLCSTLGIPNDKCFAALPLKSLKYATKTLCVASSKNVVQIYSYHGGDDIRKNLEIEAYEGSVNDLVFSYPNNKLSIVWDAVTGAKQFELKGHDAPLSSVCPHSKTVHRVFSCGMNKGEPFMVEWHEGEGGVRHNYKGYLKQDVLGELPPVIGIMLLVNNESILVNLVLVDCAKTCACNDSTVASEPKKGKDTKEYLLGTEEVSVEECCFKKGKRVLTDKDQEAVKECYKEYIGMVKIYYEEAKRSRHGEPGDVAVNCRGTAGKERPQADARIDAEVEEMLDETPRKRSKTEKEDVNMEDVNSGGNYEATIHEKEAGTSRSDDFIIIT